MDYWCWQNLVDQAVLTADSAGALLATNLLDPRVGKIWRSNFSTGGEIQVDFISDAQVAAVGVFGGNVEIMSSVTISLGSDAAGTDVHTQTVIEPGTPQVVALFRAADGTPEPKLARHLTISAEGPVPLEAGRVWAGPVNWRTLVGHTVGGSNWQVVDLSARSVTPKNGAFLIDVADRRRTFTAAYDALYPEEYLTWAREMDAGPGQHGQILFVPDPGVYPSNEWSILGYLRELPENTFLSYQRGGRTMTIVEAG